MRRISESISGLVKKRLEQLSQLEGLFIAEPAFYRVNSVVFNAFMKFGTRGLVDIFLEVSRRVEGCQELVNTIANISGMNCMPYFHGAWKDPGSNKAFAIAHYKFCGSFLYEDFLRSNPDRIVDFFLYVEKMISRIHKRGRLMPTGWNNQRVLFVNKNKFPVLIGYSGVRPVKTKFQFELGKSQDWRTFLFIIRQWEKRALSVHQSKIEIVKALVLGKISKKK